MAAFVASVVAGLMVAIILHEIHPLSHWLPLWGQIAVIFAPATLTAACVWWVPNRLNGFNVSYIAGLLVAQGIAPAGKPRKDPPDD